jgi:hypothetical protein
VRNIGNAIAAKAFGIAKERDMEPILFVMALLGCGESDASCREVRIDQARYRSEAACMAATEATLMRNDDLVFPNVVAQCRPAGAGPTLLRGSDVLRPAPGQARPEMVRVASAGALRSFR